MYNMLDPTGRNNKLKAPKNELNLTQKFK